MVGKPGIVFLISPELFAFISLDTAIDTLRFFLPFEIALDDAKLLIVHDILTVDRVKVTFTQSQVMDGIKEVRFANAVITDKAVYPAAEIKFSLGVVFEVYYRKVLEVHILIFLETNLQKYCGP